MKAVKEGLITLGIVQCMGLPNVFEKWEDWHCHSGQSVISSLLELPIHVFRITKMLTNYVVINSVRYKFMERVLHIGNPLLVD